MDLTVRSIAREAYSCVVPLNMSSGHGFPQPGSHLPACPNVVG